MREISLSLQATPSGSGYGPMGTRILLCVHPTYPSHLINDSLQQAFQGPIQGLYASNTSLPLGQRNGLRQEYRFGLYSCAYTNGSGLYSGHTIASRFQPYNTTTSDIFLNDSRFLELVPHSRTCHTSDPIPMSLITVYSSQAYL